VEYLFSDLKRNKKYIEGAYKKLKSCLYYDKTLVFAKKRVAIFESNKVYFNDTLTRIAKALVDKDESYFLDLIHKIDFKVLPKAYEFNDDCDCINGNVNHKKRLKKLIFIIDMPIELYIIDFLWTLLLGKIVTEKQDFYQYQSATRFKSSVYYNQYNSLNEGIDFDSNRSFLPYFNLYKNWRDGAFEIIEKEYKKHNLLLLCLDIKSFYYSVDFNFEDINQYVNNDFRMQSFSFLTDIIRNIYLTYTLLIKPYKKEIFVKNNNVIFPIGIFSVYVLRELFMNKIDTELVSKLTPLYYRRYVDDMLIVLKSKSNIDNIKKKDIIKKYLLDNKILEEDDKILSFCNCNLKIQESKVNCFKFPQGQKSVFVDVYKQTIQVNSSEGNLLPDIDVLDHPFILQSYSIQNLELSNKIRDLGFLKNNNYNATRYIITLLQLVKNTYLEDNQIIDKKITEIEEYYSGSQLIEFSNNWKSLFELFFILNRRDKAKHLYKNIKNEIHKISFSNLEKDQIYENNTEYIFIKLKDSLLEKLEIAVSLSATLKLDNLKNIELKKLTKAFIDCNFVNHHLISKPMENYLKLDRLDRFKLKWSPRFIKYEEFIMMNILNEIDNKICRDDNKRYKKIFKLYIFVNKLYKYLDNPIKITPEISGITSVYIKNTYTDTINVAIANTKIDSYFINDDIEFPTKNNTFGRKKQLYELLYAAKAAKANILVFPEFYMPFEWILEISDFLSKSKITIITGLKYIIIDKHVYNYVCTIVPVMMSTKYSSIFVQLREKNFYAPKEMISLSQKKLTCKNHDRPVYYLINNGNFVFTNLLCYEFTDIVSRAILKSKIDVLFVPQFNKDTNYFSALVNTAVRDLYCFVVQANTSIYGDSRITAPYNTVEKNILRVKGGDNDVILVAKLEINEILIQKKNDYSNFKNQIERCYNCSLDIEKRKCNECNIYGKNKKLKGLPPNY